MAKDLDMIACTCSDNDDLCGTWHAKDVKEECRAMGIPEDEWAAYVLDHLFADYSGWTPSIEAAFLSSNVITMRLMIGFYVVTLAKGFK